MALFRKTSEKYKTFSLSEKEKSVRLVRNQEPLKIPYTDFIVLMKKV